MPRSEGPLQALDDLLAAFATDLRELRARAGNPTYRELAREAHYSAGTLSDAAGGKKLPTLAVTLAFVGACGGDPVEWERRWRADAAELAARRGRSEQERLPEDGQSPYVGLAAFQAEDAGRFFGREKLVAELLRLVATERFVSVFGASGVGKSSLLRAGLAPAIQGSPVVLMTPGARPIEECAIALAKATGESAAVLRDELVTGGLHLRARQTAPEGGDLVLVIDQFEEVFTLGQNADERGQFIDVLLTAAQAPNSRLRVVLGVRADFYPHCAQQPALAEALRRGQLVVGAMSSQELQRAITQPAVDAGYSLERALLAAVVADSAGNAAALPLVSHALLETWRRRHGTLLTLAGYQAAGGIQDALAHTAERTYHALTDDQQHRARAMFLRLIALGEGTEDTKRRVPLDEFDASDMPVLDQLIEARLLCRDRDTVEITHEALIRCWPRLGGWLSSDRDGLRLHRQLTHAAEVWDSDSRDPSTLYRGNRLTQLAEWATDRTLSPRERDFLAASRALHADEQAAARRQTRRLRRLVALLVVLLVLTTTAVGLAVSAQNTSADQRDQAVIQKILGQANTLRSTDSALAAQLALAAYRLSPDADTRSTVLSLLATPFATQLPRQSAGVYQLAVSPNGRLLATAIADGVQLWDISDAAHPQMRGKLASRDGILALAISQDGGTIATAGSASLRLWNVADAAKPVLRADLPSFASIESLSFSHDGALLATGTRDGAVQLWSLTGSAQPRRTVSAEIGTEVRAAVFSPLDHTLAIDVADNDVSTTEFRDADDLGQSLATLPGTSPGLYSLAYAPNGKTVAKGNADGTIGLWDVTDRRAPKNVAVLSGPAGGVRSLVFSPDSGTLTASGNDASVLLWTVTEPAHPITRPSLSGFLANVSVLAYRPDGRTLVVGGDDGVIRFERLADYTFAARANGVVGSVSFTPDGRTLVDAEQYGRTVDLRDVGDPFDKWSVPADLRLDGRVALMPQGHVMVVANSLSPAALWDTTDIHRPSGPTQLFPSPNTLPYDPLTLYGPLAFSANGRVLAAVGLGSIALWDTSDQAQLRQIGQLPAEPSLALALALSPTGRLVAWAGVGKSTDLWDVSTADKPRLIGVLPGLASGSVRALAFSPDGRMLAASSDDNTVRLFDLTDFNHPMPIGALSGHGGPVNALAFSPDGRTLATGSSDDTAKLWDVHDPRDLELIATLTGHTGSINTLAYSSDGRTLATGSSDRSIGLWDTDVEHMAAHLCSLAWPRISQGDWQRYLPGFAYQPPCPS